MARPAIEGEVSDMTGQKTKGTTQRRRSAVGAFVLSMALGLAGCRTDGGDVERWANTAQGPRKLVAVLTHDKYPTDLRIEAAMMLVSMKPRGGRRIGIQGTDEQPGLIDALAQMQPASRTAIVTRLVPKLQQEMLKPLPAAQAGVAVADLTVPYKDAAFALLTHDDGALLTDEGLRKGLKATLADVHKAAKDWLTSGRHTIVCTPFPNYQVTGAEADRSKVPALADQPASAFPDLQTSTLKNGLKIVLAQRKNTPNVSMNLMIDAGYAADQFAKPGVASLAMNLLDEGTKTMSALQISVATCHS